MTVYMGPRRSCACDCRCCSRRGQTLSILSNPNTPPRPVPTAAAPRRDFCAECLWRMSHATLMSLQECARLGIRARSPYSCARRCSPRRSAAKFLVHAFDYHDCATRKEGSGARAHLQKPENPLFLRLASLWFRAMHSILWLQYELQRCVMIVISSRRSTRKSYPSSSIGKTYLRLVIPFLKCSYCNFRGVLRSFIENAREYIRATDLRHGMTWSRALNV